MTQEQKELLDSQKDLLLKDLCARLPYGVKVLYDNHVKELQYIEAVYNEVKLLDYTMNYTVGIDEIKPYLFPLSSMTEEQRYDFYCRFIENEIDYDDFKEFYIENNMWHKMLTSIDDCDSVVDWFNKYHFDYRGLIPMGLAKDATNSIVY